MIETKNDGKGRYQSWEAEMTDNSSDSVGHYNVIFTGYGATEDESKLNVIKQFDKLIKKLKRIKDELHIVSESSSSIKAKVVNIETNIGDIHL